MALKRSNFARKPPKARPCKVCEKDFVPERPPGQKVCSPKCAGVLGRAKVKAEKTKEHNKERKALREKSVKWWIEKVQKLCNQYIRMRDRKLPCISCGSTQTPQWDAGHFRPAGNNSALRFDEDNIHKQCSACNNHKSGNLLGYREALRLKIGERRLERLDTHPQMHKWTVDELRAVEYVFKQKLKLELADIAKGV